MMGQKRLPLVAKANAVGEVKVAAVAVDAAAVEAAAVDFAMGDGGIEPDHEDTSKMMSDAIGKTKTEDDEKEEGTGKETVVPNASDQLNSSDEQKKISAEENISDDETEDEVDIQQLPHSNADTVEKVDMPSNMVKEEQIQESDYKVENFYSSNNDEENDPVKTEELLVQAEASSEADGEKDEMKGTISSTSEQFPEEKKVHVLEAPLVMEEVADFKYATKLELLLNKPKRPFSGYNLFFKVERDRILNSVKNPESKDHEKPYTSEDVERVATQLKISAKNRGYSGVTIRESHGDEAPMFGCGDLARLVGEKWKKITQENKAIFESYAGKEREKFQTQMKQWKERLRYFEQIEEQQLKENLQHQNQQNQQVQNLDNDFQDNNPLQQGLSHHHLEDGDQPKRKRGRPKKSKMDDLTPLPHNPIPVQYPQSMPVAMNRPTPRRADAANSLVALGEPNDGIDFASGGLSDGSNNTNMNNAMNTNMNDNKGKRPNPNFYESLIMEQQRRIIAKRRTVDDPGSGGVKMMNPIDSFDKGPGNHHHNYQAHVGPINKHHYNQHQPNSKMGNMNMKNPNPSNSGNPPLTPQQRQEIIAILQQRQQLQQQQERLRQMQQEASGGGGHVHGHGHRPINSTSPNRGMDNDHHM